MRLLLGNDFFEARKGRTAPIYLDTQALINGHVLMVGASGVGKSHTIRRLIRQASESGSQVRFHVFDVHGDLDIPGASVMQFSEQAPFGRNPLVVNPDPDFGGVRKAIQSFIRTINQASATALGVKQEAVVRNLLHDVYREFGFFADNPGSWAVNELEVRLVSAGADNRLYLEVPFAEKDQVQALGARWDRDKRHWWVHVQNYQGDLRKWPPAFKARAYPTLKDVEAYCRRLHLERFMGSDQKAVGALVAVNKRARTLQRKLLEDMKRRNFEGADEEAQADLESAREKAIEAYVDYVNAIQTGVELDNLLKYDSPDVLKSVLDRIQNLQSTGLFKANEAPFDPDAKVWRYKLNALSQEEKKMMVLFTLQDIFSRAVQRGEQPDVREIVVLDELGVYAGASDDKGDGIIGIIAREARKFGLALWGAHQQPTGVPESLLTSVGTKVILGIDEMYWQLAMSKLKVEANLLEWIRPHHTMAVQLKEKSSTRSRWRWVQL